MKYSFLIFIIISVYFGCTSNNDRGFCSDNLKNSFVIPSDPKTKYFPLDSLLFDDEIQSDSFIKTTFSKILFDLREPGLDIYRGEGKILRLLWMPAKGTASVIRIEKCSKKTVAITVKKLEGIYDGLDFKGYKLSTDTTFRSNNASLLSYFEHGAIQNFYKLSSLDSQDWASYKDITTWVLECNDNGKYHCINRFVLGHNSTRNYVIAYGLYKVLKDANALYDERNLW